jgi:L-methionine (R)-S-oxide reductase
LPSPSAAVNWAGFYFLNPSNPRQLLLGPFQGQVACQTIALGRGVCGAAAQTGKTQLVPDVDAFPGHIACDGASRSEIVVPIVKEGKVRFLLLFSFTTPVLSAYWGDGGVWSTIIERACWRPVQTVAIIDIDCAELNGFTEEDQKALEELAALLAESCDFA